MKTILAEKPSVARTIASVVGANQRKDGYLSGNGFNVTWAIGHLVGLSMPKAYGFEKWSLDHLPIIPESFRLEVTQDQGIKKQFNIIKALFSQSETIIVATDAGREGELIYRYIHALAKPSFNVVVKRLWISDLTEETIRMGMNNLEPISNYDHLYYAAKARSEADWLVGINFTQAYTLSSGKSKALSIGRVQTATLWLIVNRFQENVAFQSKPFFIPQIVLDDTEGRFTLSCEQKFLERDDANKVVEGIKGSISPELIREDKEGEDKPPLLYDLTTLQRTANQIYNYTAQQTLDLVQSLYEKHKLVTYPRTESEYLATSQKSDVLGTFENLGNFEFHGIETDSIKETCYANIPNNRIFNDAKVTDHHAIIPTGRNIDLDMLTEQELKVYKMIIKRFFQCFLSNCRKANRKISLELNGTVFSAKSTQILEKGWRTLTEIKPQDVTLPETKRGESRKIIECLIHEGMSKPKPLYTESSLLGSMETAGQFVEDKSLREGLKERGLGTPATRANIIETLIKRQYVVREKSKLIPTEIGKMLIESLKDISVCSPKLTGEWEYRLKQIERNELSYNSFLENIKSYVRGTLPDVLKAAKKLSQIQTPEEKLRNQSFGNCPKCGAGEIGKGKKSFYCSNWNKEPKCDFTIWRSCFNKKLTDGQVTELLTKGTTKKIKGFKSKAGKPFNAKLSFDENLRIKPIFD